MALLHTLRSVAKYMSPYAQLPVFAALLRQKNMLFSICTEQGTLLQGIFYAVVPKNNSSS